MDTLYPHAENDNLYTVYALIDPRDYTVRYIGITDDVYRRFWDHLRCGGENPKKDAWITELKAENIMLIMKTLEVVESEEKARERETFWIHHHHFLGADLYNQSIPTIRIPSTPKKYNKVRRGTGLPGRKSENARVRDVVLYHHTTGAWPENLSDGMRYWYRDQYFTKPNKKKDGVKYDSHVRAYNRGRQWIAEFEATASEKD